MKYIVKINYYYFTFTDAKEAMIFAQKALEHGNENKTVEIELVLIKEENEESEEQ